MEQEITEIIHHMLSSQQQMAKVLEAERHIIDHIAKIVNGIPDLRPSLYGVEAIVKNSSEVTKTISSYLVSLADFEEALAENLTAIMTELQIKDEGE
jgi:methyl-accepting chemotaxis protein